MNGVHSCIRATSFSEQNLALFINGEDASSCALGYLFEANRTDQGGTRVAKEGVREVLLRLESSVGFR